MAQETKPELPVVPFDVRDVDQDTSVDENSNSDKRIDQTAFDKDPTKKEKSKSSFGNKEKDMQNPMDRALILVASGSDAETIKSFVEIDRIISNSQNRKHLLHWACLIITLHLFTIAFIVINNGTLVSFLGLFSVYMSVSDNVLIALLGSTTANIIGLGYIVLKGIFYVDDIHGNYSKVDIKEKD